MHSVVSNAAARKVTSVWDRGLCLFSLLIVFLSGFSRSEKGFQMTVPAKKIFNLISLDQERLMIHIDPGQKLLIGWRSLISRST